MPIHFPDNPWVRYPSDIPRRQHARRSYSAEVPALSLDEQSRLVEQVMLFAFDTLGVRHLDVRVHGADTDSTAEWIS